MFKIQASWLDCFDPEHHSAFFATSPTGWTNGDLGKEWLVALFIDLQREKHEMDMRLLITGGHASHINMSSWTGVSNIKSVLRCFHLTQLIGFSPSMCHYSVLCQ